jgi:hypothetical protein
MPVKATAYVLGQGDILLIEDISVLADDITAYGVHYDPSASNTDSFHYTFEICFRGADGLLAFRKTRSALERSKKILWYNPSQNGTITLTLEDASVEHTDENMDKLSEQYLRIVTFCESDELVESEAS